MVRQTTLLSTKISLCLALAIPALIIPAHSALAWGAKGHRVVGKIAENHLTPEARRGVEAVLGTESLARASTWADSIRSDASWDHAKPWHYINVPDDGDLATVERASGGDILEALERFEGVLRDGSARRQDKVEALRFLCHFLGDLHQPLHVGRATDRGGNDIDISWFGNRRNLHSLWDSGLINHMDLSYTEIVEFIDHTTPEQVAQWQRGSYLEWAKESQKLRAQVYDFGVPDSQPMPSLGWKYYERNVATVEERLLVGGVRLAGVLNAVFAPPAESAKTSGPR